MFKEKSTIARQNTILVTDPNSGEDHTMRHPPIPQRNESLLYIPSPVPILDSSPPCWKVQVILESGESQAFQVGCSLDTSLLQNSKSQCSTLHLESVGFMT